jgi:SulP family sulfate permease
MFFGATADLDRNLARIDRQARDGVRVVVLSLKHARNPDAVCLAMMDDFLQRLAARKVAVLLCGVRRGVDRALRRSGLLARLDSVRHIFHEGIGTSSSTLEAVRFAYELLGDDLCNVCPRRHADGNGKEPLYYMI